MRPLRTLLRISVRFVVELTKLVCVYLWILFDSYFYFNVMIGRNNPLNIRFSPVNKWLGQSGYTKGFCNFRNIFYGIRAAAKLLMQSYPKQGFKTYAQIIGRFAPECENPTSSYLFYICDKCKVFPFDCPVSVEDYATLIYYMWCFEQGSKHRPDRSIADIELMINDIEIYGSSL